MLQKLQETHNLKGTVKSFLTYSVICVSRALFIVSVISFMTLRSLRTEGSTYLRSHTVEMYIPGTTI